MSKTEPKSSGPPDGQELLPDELGSLKLQLWRHVVQKSVWLIFLLALSVLLSILLFIDFQRIGYFFVTTGLTVSFLGTMILAIPSTSTLRRMSVRYKFIGGLNPAYNSFRSFETVEKGDFGFGNLLHLIRTDVDGELENVDKIEPHGNHIPMKSKINGEIYDVGPSYLNSARNRISDSLETICYNKGVKILLIGFFIQLTGSIHIAVTS